MTKTPEKKPAIQLIPPGTYSYSKKPRFVSDYRRNLIRGFSLDGNDQSQRWLVFGPEGLVLPGEVVKIVRADEDIVFVQVLEIVAYRIVKKHNQETVRYVLATWDRCVEEDEDDLLESSETEE